MREQATMYEMIGGATGVRALADAFYEAMDRLPEAAVIRAMHGEDLRPMKQKLYEFLSGWFGGPRLYFERYGGVCMHSAHGPFSIGEAERDQWLLCMKHALDEVGVSAEARDLLRVPMYRFADGLRNREAA